MKRIKKAFYYAIHTDIIKTIFLNLYYFPFKQAIRLPILVAYRTQLQTVRGGVEIVDNYIRTGVFLLGYRELRAQCSLYERTIWHVEGKIVLKGRVFIGRGSSLAVRGVCVFSDNFTISGRSSIICEDRVEFNKNVLMSWDVLIMDTDYHSILDITGRKINEDRSIIIGNNVWIGCRCTILKGSIIPDGCIISAGSIIAGILPKENAVYSSEKKVIKENITWLR